LKISGFSTDYKTKEKRQEKKDKRYPDESGKESGICRGKLERLCLKNGFFLVFKKFEFAKSC